MAVDFNAKFQALNTNRTGDSANILDRDEVEAAKNNGSIFSVNVGMTAERFKQENQKCSAFDLNADGIVSVDEQKSSIMELLKNVYDSIVARFFKGDIEYDDSSASAAKQIDEQVQASIEDAKSYIENAKQNNEDIFNNNEETEANNEDVKGAFDRAPLNEKYLDWHAETYTDGFGNTYEIEKRLVNGEFQYKWGDDIYNSWEELVKDMQTCSAASQPETSEQNYNEKGWAYNTDALDMYYSFDGKYGKNGKPNGRSLTFNVGTVGQGKDMAYGINVKYQF